MKTKKCFKCNIVKSLEDFYKHKQMGDGHLNKCKECTKKDTQERTNKLSENFEWFEKEKERHRNKYYRLGYKEKHKPTSKQKKEIMERYFNLYPEKRKAHFKSSNLKSKVKGNHLHHWSYNDEHFKDVIELEPKIHAFLHRHIVYDQERKMYRTHKENLLLDTKENHIEYLEYILKNENTSSSNSVRL